MSFPKGPKDLKGPKDPISSYLSGSFSRSIVHELSQSPKQNLKGYMRDFRA